MHTSQHRIAIDVRYLSHGLLGGVRTYIHNLVAAMLRENDRHEFILWADTKAPFELSPLPGPAELRLLPWSSGVSSIRNDLRISAEIARAGADIVHYPANYGFAPSELPALITLHDAINLLPLARIWRTHSKQPKSVLMMTYLHLMTRQAIKRSPFVVTVSDYSRREILKHSQLPPERVRVIYSAPESVFRPVRATSLDDVRHRHQLREHIILADAIKNPACSLRAYRCLPEDLRSRTSLVFFSRRQPSGDVIEAQSSGECTVILRPSQAELVNLYNVADIFVFPSWYEGFGLPVLEAMACGTPVIASSRGSLPEVVGTAGFLVDAEDHATVAERTTSLLMHPDLRAERREQSLRWAAQFTWERTARQMFQLYDVIARQTDPLRTLDTATCVAAS